MDIDTIAYFTFAIISMVIEIYNLFAKYVYSPSSSQAVSKDRGTFIMIWLTSIVSGITTSYCIFLGYGWKIFVVKFVRSFMLIPIGIFLVVSGHYIRQLAMKQLGVWFTMTVRVDKKQKLIDSGLYRHIRHPAYTGLLLYILGLVLLVNNWLSLLGLFTPIMFIFLYRIQVEEYELRDHFGSKYDDYTRKVPFKIVPYIF